MKKSFIIFTIIALILTQALIVSAQNQTVDITRPEETEILIKKGQDITLSLPLFSRTTVRIYEGANMKFNIVDPDTNAVLIRNELTVKEITPDSTTILLSLDGKNQEEFIIYPSKESQLNYTYKFMPFMILKQTVTHYEENPDNRNVVLFFNVPFLKVGKSPTTGPLPGSVIVDPTTVQTNNPKKGIDPIIFVMIGVIIILIAIILYFKRSKKSKHH